MKWYVSSSDDLHSDIELPPNEVVALGKYYIIQHNNIIVLILYIYSNKILNNLKIKLFIAISYSYDKLQIKTYSPNIAGNMPSS